MPPGRDSSFPVGAGPGWSNPLELLAKRGRGEEAARTGVPRPLLGNTTLTFPP